MLKNITNNIENLRQKFEIIRDFYVNFGVFEIFGFFLLCGDFCQEVCGEF